MNKNKIEDMKWNLYPHYHENNNFILLQVCWYRLLFVIVDTIYLLSISFRGVRTFSNRRKFWNYHYDSQIYKPIFIPHLRGSFARMEEIPIGYLRSLIFRSVQGIVRAESRGSACSPGNRKPYHSKKLYRVIRNLDFGSFDQFDGKKIASKGVIVWV